MCWLASKQEEAQRKLQDVREKARQIIAEKGSSFVGRDLTWNIPPHFPRWVELLTGKVKEQPASLQLQGQGGGILTIQVQQKQPETGLNYNNHIQQGNNSTVSYQQSGYPQADNSQGSLINANQQQHHHQNMFNANTYS